MFLTQALGIQPLSPPPPWQVHPHPTWAGTPPGQVHPQAGTRPGQVHSRQCMLGYSQQAGSTHPTGMHSCRLVFLLRNGVR